VVRTAGTSSRSLRADHASVKNSPILRGGRVLEADLSCP
jgi:hypothetical protein